MIYEVDHIAILQFVVPALFLQWEGLFDDAEEVQCNAKRVAIGIIGKWSQSNPCGRVIVFHLSAKQPCPGKAIVIPCLKKRFTYLTVQKGSLTVPHSLFQTLLLINHRDWIGFDPTKPIL